MLVPITFKSVKIRSDVQIMQIQIIKKEMP